MDTETQKPAGNDCKPMNNSLSNLNDFSTGPMTWLSPPVFGRILIFAQYWTGDRDHMMSLLSLISDLEEEPCADADFILFPRKDTRERGFASVEKLETKFKVIRKRSIRPHAGWPIGPNAVAMDAFRVTHEMLQAGEFHYDAALLLEADDLPLRRGWLRELINEWNRQERLFLGHWDGHGSDPRTSHMNGNLMFHPKAFNLIPEMAYGEVPRGPWDRVFWDRMMPVSTPSRLIFSDYQLNTRKNPLVGCDRIFAERQHIHQTNPLLGESISPCFLHGCKGLSGMDCVRSKILLDKSR